MGLSDGEPMDLPPLVRTGFAIIFGELDGGKFNWNTMEWDEPQ
jgi:hypothetical protein